MVCRLTPQLARKRSLVPGTSVCQYVPHTKTKIIYSFRARPKRTSDHERLYRWDSRFTLCFAGRSYSINETAGTRSLSLAAVVTHSRTVVVCPGWASPEKRSRPVYARWYQVHTYPVHNTNHTLKPRQFLLPCRLLLPYRFFCSTLKPRLVAYVQTFIAAQIFFVLH